MNANPFSFGW